MSGQGPSEVTAAEAVALVHDGTYLLDVREQDEWDAGHAPQATLVPLSELAQRQDEIPTDAQVLVVCHSGMRSLRATAALRAAGVDAVNVAGGMIAWRDAQGELTGGSSSGPTVG
ncbi:rhodanese-like domain-containing protein [Frigoribacterium sp. 2-23]|uniref:rhodanese-like domain-containing protein n=1 Tax=Frigoribacterium sp. 2-23 TaxID=3415006 RepID=UPI003C7051AE